MYRVLHEIKQSERCCSVLQHSNYDEEYMTFSEGNLLKVYSKYDLVNAGEMADPVSVIKSDNDIICAKVNSFGDSNNISNIYFKKNWQ